MDLALRTRRLTLPRALKILQLKYGSQIQTIKKNKNTFIINDNVANCKKVFHREEILQVEEEIYKDTGIETRIKI